jgi:hypothetical protein
MRLAQNRFLRPALNWALVAAGICLVTYLSDNRVLTLIGCGAAGLCGVALRKLPGEGRGWLARSDVKREPPDVA